MGSSGADNVTESDGAHSGVSCVCVMSGGRRGGMPNSQGAKVARCANVLMMQAFVAYIVREERLLSPLR